MPLIRYAFDTSSNGWLELQWYLFSAVFLLGRGLHPAAQRARPHRRHHRSPVAAQARLDRPLGGLLFLLPMATIILVLSWPMVIESIVRNEFSADAGGLLRWPVKLLIPLGFLLLVLQGMSEIIKRAAFLRGHIPDPLEQHREPMAEEFLKGAVE